MIYVDTLATIKAIVADTHGVLPSDIRDDAPLSAIEPGDRIEIILAVGEALGLDPLTLWPCATLRDLSQARNDRSDQRGEGEGFCIHNRSYRP